MNPYKANLLNSLTLIIIGLWGAYPYLFLTGSPTSLIPVVFGILLFVLSSRLKKENKITAHIKTWKTNEYAIIISLISK